MNKLSSRDNLIYGLGNKGLTKREIVKVLNTWDALKSIITNIIAETISKSERD